MKLHFSCPWRCSPSLRAGDEEGEDDALPPVLPKAVSQIDFSHRRMVADLAWLHPRTQINSKGQLLQEENLDGQSHQFVTVSGDGQCLFWDTRYVEIAEGQLPWVARPRQPVGGDKQKEKEASKWLPLFRMQVKRLEGVGELSICRMALLGGSDGRQGASQEGWEDHASHLVASTEDGHLLLADWRATVGGAGKEEGGAEGPSAFAAAAAKDEEGGDTQDAPDYVQWMVPDHTRYEP